MCLGLIVSVCVRHYALASYCTQGEAFCFQPFSNIPGRFAGQILADFKQVKIEHFLPLLLALYPSLKHTHSLPQGGDFDARKLGSAPVEWGGGGQMNVSADIYHYVHFLASPNLEESREEQPLFKV